MISAKVTTKKIHNVEKGVAEGVQKSVEEVAIAIEGQTVLNAPYDTGQLRSSISREIGKNSAIIYSNSEYAKIHEFGGTITPKNGPYLVFKGKDGRFVFAKSVTIKAANQGKGYFKPAVERVKTRLSAIVGRIIRAEIRSN